MAQETKATETKATETNATETSPVCYDIEEIESKIASLEKVIEEQDNIIKMLKAEKERISNERDDLEGEK